MRCSSSAAIRSGGRGWEPAFPDRAHAPGHLLFDLEADPRQRRAIQDPEVERRLAAAMADHFQACAAPPDQFTRMGVPPAGA